MKAFCKTLGDRIVGRARRSQQDSGARAEHLAARHLEIHGLKIIARNVRFRGGEIDLICLDGSVLVFVEVRLRRNPRYGGAAASITPAKQQRVIRAAQQWLAAAGRDYCRHSCRMDAVLFEDLDGAPNWIKGAFDLGNA